MPSQPRDPGVPDSPLPGFLTTAQVAERTGWDQQTVAHYAKEGTRFKAVKVASIWLVEEASLVEYLSQPRKPGPNRGVRKPHSR